MAWEERVRLLSWVVFTVMWIPLAIMISTAVTGGDEENIAFAIIPFFVLCILFALLLVGSFGIGRLEKDNIRKKGIPANATIISVMDTGWLINNQPKLCMELDVHPPCDSAFRTTVEYVVPHPFLPQLQPGTTVKVYYIEGTTEVALAGL